ncbi:c-type cytochrome [Methylobacterium sp. R2-1]|uniref:c-type cytochrome n=1 Tax=Methylobacterium sp. R2-1 TaxID=2587064 RepID=UPI00160A96B6|nr:c-type cytochrome [Methylobacterium sp. R2-1]MBB2960123.1 cytochrome c [Methylobacterium sp. R2-1]
MTMGATRILGVIAALLLALPAMAQMRGHGGPVRALAITGDGRLAVSGGFDQAAIIWGLDTGAALSVLRFHDGAVNAVAALSDGRFASGSEDGRIALWRLGQAEPERVLEGHTGPVAGLAVSPDGTTLASAAWDGTARIWPLAGRSARVLEGHKGNVNAVAFLPGGGLVTAGADASVRIWTAEGQAVATATLPSALSALAVTADGEIAAAGADATVRFLARDGSVRGQVELGPAPVVALAPSPDGTRIAAASAGGSVAMIERATRKVLFNLVGPGLPVWSVAWRPDGSELVTGGSDRLVRRWNASNGEPIGPLAMPRPADALAAFHGERGAEVFRACVACHTLTPDEAPRAGPTLAGLFGRRIAAVPGYRYSEALRGMDIVWTPETVARLFEVGPARYTPGTRMPEQTINSAEDREALMRFLAKATDTQPTGPH